MVGPRGYTDVTTTEMTLPVSSSRGPERGRGPTGLDTKGLVPRSRRTCSTMSLTC